MFPAGDGIQPGPADGAVPSVLSPWFWLLHPFGRELGLGMLPVPPRAPSGDFNHAEQEQLLVFRVLALGKERKREKKLR